MAVPPHSHSPLAPKEDARPEEGLAGSSAVLMPGREGRFVVVEGIDGAGKTTVLHRLATVYRERGFEVVATAQPSRGEVGQLLRHHLGGGDPDPAFLALLFSADRLDHAASVIHPALARGAWVLCDRYMLSTLVYQAHALDARFGEGEGAPWVEVLNRAAPIPSLTLLLDIAPDIAWNRLQSRLQSQGGGAEIYERRDVLRANAERYKVLSRRAAVGPVVVVDAGREPDVVLAQCVAAVDATVSPRSPSNLGIDVRR